MSDWNKWEHHVLHEIKTLREDQKNHGDYLNRIENTLSRQEVHLQEHMRRTELSENRLEHVENSLAPIQKHVIHLEGGFKLLGLLSALTAAIYTLNQIFKWFV